jgi:large subunit ribosomal protein L30
MARIRITQTKSIINRTKKQKRTIEALGLGKINQSREFEDNEQVRGMIRIVQHIVNVEPAG